MTTAGASPTVSCRPERTWQRALLLSVVSNATVLFVMYFGVWLWPEKLPVNSQNIFWLPSGVNLAGLLILGLRYWPVLLLNAFPAWLLLGEPLPLCLIASLANALEALLGAWLLLKAGRFSGSFDSLRSVGVLVIGSLVTPLVNTLLIPAYFCLTGIYPWSEYPRALGNWNLANATAILLMTPLVVATFRRGERTSGTERMLTMTAVGVLAYLAFNGLFAGHGMNLAFLAFPVVLYTAVRFGIRETACSLGITLVAIYAALITNGRYYPRETVPAILWFAQAFTWVLAATGLLVAALGTERRRAERRSLEASLAAEQARLAALRYQINPHFLFNALNSIRATLPLPETTAREMITSLAGYLRTTLDSGEASRLSLREELAHIRKYLAIEQHRFGEDLVISYEIEPEAEGVSIPPFLLQPLVENAIRHGLERNAGVCRITLGARRNADNLSLFVANTGAWQEPGRPQSTGLANVRRRLELLYGPEATLEIDKSERAVQISLTLPL